MKLINCLISLCMLLLADTSQAAYRMVFVDGSYPYISIQAAINDSAPGDTVFISSGTYSEALVIDRELTLIGAGINSTNPLCHSRISQGMVISSGPVSLSNLYLEWIETTTDLAVISCRLYGYNRPAILASNWCDIYLGGTQIGISGYYNYSGNTASVISGSARNSVVEDCKILGQYGCSYFATTGNLFAYNTLFSHSGGNNAVPGGTVYSSFINCIFSSITGLDDNHPESRQFRFCAKTSAWSTAGGNNIVVTGSDWDSNYHPTVGSLLIDAGDPNGPLDLDGSRADIGCYGGSNPFNDNGVANWQPFMQNFSISNPLVGQGEELMLQTSGMVGPTWTGSGQTRAGDTQWETSDTDRTRPGEPK